MRDLYTKNSDTGRGVKSSGNYADVICTWPLIGLQNRSALGGKSQSVLPAAPVSVCECAGDGTREEGDGVEEADDAGGDGLALGELGLQLDEEDAEAEGDPVGDHVDEEGGRHHHPAPSAVLSCCWRRYCNVIHAFWRAWDTPNSLISMSHKFFSDFDINVPHHVPTILPRFPKFHMKKSLTIIEIAP